MPVIAQVLTFDSVRVGSGRSRRVGTVRRMVTVTRTVLVDDLDGSQDDVHTVRFSLDGTDFEIDLNAGNEARLRDKLARFVENATRSGPTVPLVHVPGGDSWPTPGATS